MIEDLLHRLPQSSIRLGLERITAACAALGTPQGRYPAVLVAGTNGKGSTCAFLAAALGRTGRRVGLYTSPHLISFRERIRIDGAPITAEALERSAERLLRAWPPFGEPGHPDALTYFEAATALAFDAFAHAGVEVAVLEVGLGGRLDATNVQGTRLAATAVTRIGVDHVEYLGSSLAGIAAEKGAIARPGIPLIISPQQPEVLEVLRRRAADVGAPLVEVGKDVGLEPSEGGLEYRGEEWRIPGLRLGLLGQHQLQNAAVAIAALEAGRETFGVTPEQVREGLAAASWPGRLEVIPGEPLTILDGAHNPDGARTLVASFAALWPGVRPHLVFGALRDKDRRGILEALAPLAASFHLCPPPSDRALSVEALGAEVAALGAEVHSHGSVEEAIVAAKREAGPRGVVLICGSLYLVGAARAILLGGAK